jgi:phage replication O-like protein O
MNQSAKIINFPEKEVDDNNQGREDVKADIDNGYYRVANEIGLALCKAHLNDSEGRILHTVMLKTFGWNKSLDWICYDQISELTGISVDNISKIKKRLVARNILIVEGKKTGVNPVVSEWVFKSIQTHKTNKKISKSRPLNKSKQTLEPIQTHIKISESRPIQKKDTITKDTITKDTITKDKVILNIPQWLPVDVWQEFIAMRKLIKKPMTEKAKELMLTKLQKMQDAGFDAQGQLIKSIDNSWSDVYEPKNFNTRSTSENFDDKDYGVTEIPAWMNEVQS